MSRAPKEAEIAQGIEYVSFGSASTAIFVPPSVGVTNLTSEQATAIFSGEIVNWLEVGGPDQDIVLYIRDEEESSTKALRKAIFDEIPFSKNVAQVLTSAGDMMTAVENTPASVGFGS
jgi:phosphate transport system substrate-binding protein